ncbi:unnamed protein product [Chondrus crispus]|uniref:DUF1499 domain-containing protein n=1 Tax=Chondrus crispus TaxID=2769 RepID=R7QSP8_CHOCR|nr:unnamed protein product [Chondrus crispus]CDF40773.1 unnamed protein product [Chondrus crispus]|eukprot:XP_005711067.1 unnamed protein product [Chondrus crispus]
MSRHSLLQYLLVTRWRVGFCSLQSRGIPSLRNRFALQTTAPRQGGAMASPVMRGRTAFVVTSGRTFLRASQLTRHVCPAVRRFSASRTPRASIETEVGQKMKDAMKSKDKDALRALRGIRAAFLNALKETGSGDTLPDDVAMTQLRKLAKMRTESIAMFRDGGRDDLAEAEQKELEIIEQWLPSLVGEEQTTAWAKEAIEKTGASKKGDMGSTPLLSHLRVAIDTEVGTKTSSEKARMLNTAFVSSLAGVKSGFLSQGLPTPSTCRKPAMGISTMGLGNLASGAKLLLVTGALTVGAIIVLPQASSAGLFNFSGEKPSNVGLRSERYLDSCPASPNCISSMANAYDSHFVPPWTYTSAGSKKTMAGAIRDVTKAIENYPRTKIIESRPTKSEVGEGHYIYAEFKSKTFGFVDDVEFLFQPDQSTVEYRSASRLGEKDFDANRKRIRELRVALQEMDKGWASTGYN